MIHIAIDIPENATPEQVSRQVSVALAYDAIERLDCEQDYKDSLTDDLDHGVWAGREFTCRRPAEAMALALVELSYFLPAEREWAHDDEEFSEAA